MPVLTTSGMCLIKAGKRVDIAWRNVSGSAELITLISGAEATLSNYARYDLVNKYSSLNTRTREWLSDLCSSKVACDILAFDMTGQSESRVETESKINWHSKVWDAGLNLIKDKKVTDFLEKGTTQ